ncbi:MAG: HRDC domain-containing protein, partial [Actinomycetota bacterium]|nr:HRDC domain-containing protein [Actinomycetota bacterium]
GRCWPCHVGGTDPALAQRLRTWRAERARRDAVPAFVVFSDKTLSDLAARRPSTPQELLAVHGLGQAKVERYGDELLRALRGTA